MLDFHAGLLERRNKIFAKCLVATSNKEPCAKILKAMSCIRVLQYLRRVDAIWCPVTGLVNVASSPIVEEEWKTFRRSS